MAVGGVAFCTVAEGRVECFLGATDTFLRDAAITERGGEDDELLYEGSSDRGLSSDEWRFGVAGKCCMDLRGKVFGWGLREAESGRGVGPGGEGGTVSRDSLLCHKLLWPIGTS